MLDLVSHKISRNATKHDKLLYLNKFRCGDLMIEQAEGIYKKMFVFLGDSNLENYQLHSIFERI